jgi:hypothetical protein
MTFYKTDYPLNFIRIGAQLVVTKDEVRNRLRSTAKGAHRKESTDNEARPTGLPEPGILEQKVLYLILVRWKKG